MVKTFFEQDGKLDGFEKYGFTLNPSVHFRTNFFEYIVSLKAKFAFFKLTIILSIIILLMLWLKYLESPLHFRSNGVIPMLFFILLISSPLIYFFFNYLSADKNHYIQISRGHDEFVFGKLDEKKIYNKQDIAEINVYGVRNTRSLWSGCEVFILVFKNGEQIKFTSLLITSSKLSQKFPDHQIIYIEKSFPRVGSI